jgi:phosphate transport system permease protein
VSGDLGFGTVSLRCRAMSVSPNPRRRLVLGLRSPRPSGERSRGDTVLRGLCILAGLAAAFVLIEIAYQVISGAAPSVSTFGLGFLAHSDWAPNLGHFGAASMLFGTAVTSVIAMVIAVPLAVAIAIYLSTFAPRSVRTIVGPLVEMLATIPSVILGFWGIIVLAPFLQAHVEPWLHNTFGFLAIFGSPQSTGLSVFTAGLILTVMVVPIIASLSRDLFLTVPRELKEAAEALGATPWEVIRGVVLPTTFSGVAAATSLGLGRALGESIAVASVIGGGNVVHASLFETGNTLAARIALEITFVTSKLHQQSLFYLALILLVISAIVNVIARVITSRYDVYRSFV